MTRTRSNTRRALIGTLSLSAALLATACAEDAASEATPAAKTPAGSPAWLLASEPADAVAVAQVKAGAKEGDTVVVRGRIGGRAEPLTAGSPVFVIMDLGVPHCGEVPGDNCPAPWDYCCETPESINANNATVQVVGDGADPAAGGLAPLDEVVIVGTVGPRPTAGVLTIRASGIYRVGG